MRQFKCPGCQSPVSALYDAKSAICGKCGKVIAIGRNKSLPPPVVIAPAARPAPVIHKRGSKLLFGFLLGASVSLASVAVMFFVMRNDRAPAMNEPQPNQPALLLRPWRDDVRNIPLDSNERERTSLTLLDCGIGSCIIDSSNDPRGIRFTPTIKNDSWSTQSNANLYVRIRRLDRPLPDIELSTPLVIRGGITSGETLQVEVDIRKSNFQIRWDESIISTNFEVSLDRKSWLRCHLPDSVIEERIAAFSNPKFKQTQLTRAIVQEYRDHVSKDAAQSRKYLAALDAILERMPDNLPEHEEVLDGMQSMLDSLYGREK